MKENDLPNSDITTTPEQFAFRNKVMSEEAKNLAKSLLPEVYRRIKLVLSTYMDMGENEKEIVSLWIIGTYLFQEFPTFPRLYINAMKGSGKTRLLQILESLCWNATIQNSLSEAVLFRTAKTGTLIFDESEGINTKEKAGLRELFNSGYKKGSVVKRMKQVNTKDGKEMIVETFDLYGPAVLANIAGLEDTLSDRCINIILEKSDDPIRTKLIADFLENPIIRDIKRTLELILVYRCSVVVGLESIHTYNLYTLTTHTTYTTLTTSTTPELYTLKPMIDNDNLDTNHNLISDENAKFFDKINKLGINARNFELFLPIFIIARSIGEDVLEKSFEIAKQYVEEKSKEEGLENRDWALIDFVSRQESTLKFLPVSEILLEFKNFYNADDMDSINTRWIGQAFRRLKIVLDKRRIGRGIEYILNVPKAKEKLKVIKKDEPVRVEKE